MLLKGGIQKWFWHWNDPFTNGQESHSPNLLQRVIDFDLHSKDDICIHILQQVIYNYNTIFNISRFEKCPRIYRISVCKLYVYYWFWKVLCCLWTPENISIFQYQEKIWFLKEKLFRTIFSVSFLITCSIKHKLRSKKCH